MTEAEEVRALWEASRKKEAEAKFIFRGSHRYREQDGCHNCARMYRLGQFDGEDELYCTCGAGRRQGVGHLLRMVRRATFLKTSIIQSVMISYWPAAIDGISGKLAVTSNHTAFVIFTKGK